MLAANTLAVVVPAAVAAHLPGGPRTTTTVLRGLEINGTPSTDDDDVAYGNNGGVLTITLAGGSSSSKLYSEPVERSERQSGRPSGIATNAARSPAAIPSRWP